MQLRVMLEPSDDGGYTVTVPSLPGCISEGDTREDALANIREAIQLYLEPVDDVMAELRARDVALCISEQEEFQSPVVATASWGYLRLHRFDYDAPALTAWASRVIAQPWQQAYVYFKHDHGVGSGPPAVDAFLKAAAAPA